MNKFSFRMLMLAAVAAVSLGTAGMAQAYGHRMGGDSSLSTEQQATAQKMMTEFSTATDDLRRQIMSKRAELDVQLYAANPDAAKVDALSKELGGLEGKMRMERINLDAKLKKAGIPTMGHGMGMGRGMGHDMGRGMGGMRGGGCGGMGS